MPTYYLEEYSGAMRQQGQGVEIPNGPPLATQSSVFTAQEQTAAFDARTSIIGIWCDTAGCKFSHGANPDAENDTNAVTLMANVMRFWQAEPGKGWKGSVWDGSS